MSDRGGPDRPWWSDLASDPRVLACGAVLLLTALICMLLRGPVERNDARVDRETRNGEISQVAQAPDGSTVWAVRTHGRLVLFGRGSIQTLPD